jgi:hypothetical protein
MEIYISDWTHKFQNKTGLDAKANLELYKSKRVCSVVLNPLKKLQKKSCKESFQRKSDGTMEF